MRLAAAAAVAFFALAARAADPGAEAARSYTIEATGPATLKVGATGTLVVAIKPVPKTHVHPQAPLKIALSATPGLSLSKTALGRKDMPDPKAEAPRFEVPFTAPPRASRRPPPRSTSSSAATSGASSRCATWWSPST